MIRVLTCSVFLTLSITAQASVSSDLTNFFNKTGYASNVTSPMAFESQASGYFGGGSLFVRSQVREYRLVHLSMPTYRAGCGGIDLFTGSFSFLSHEKLVDLGKQVMNDAGAYAVDVMLASTVPQLKDVRDNLINLEQKANQSNINSCHMAQNLVGGMFPKTAESQQKICKDIGTQSGLFSDFAKAQQGCSSQKDFDNAMDKASKDESTRKKVILNKNLVWSMLQENPLFSSDKELAEMMMSLTGTYIIDKQGKVTNVPSLANSSDLINALVGANTGTKSAQIWQCHDSNCMRVDLKTIDIAEDQTLNYKIRVLLSELNEKVKIDDEPEPVQKGFLDMISIPALKFLMVLNSTDYGNAAIDIDEYSILIAQDLLENYMAGLLQEVSNSTFGMEINEDLVKDVQKRINNARQMIAKINPKVSQRLKEKMMLAEYISRVEKQVSSQMNAVNG
ncbi:MAG TPA: conjugal transfer protein TraH [Gammaproteobacteria bacterium]|nr:conjugal transfer protein TraH [Gammaproteobacteria bacterium]|tara:strand:- start:1602 stop:2951 length:1350 start_codon:yes stop_codon:yes gene_type:complete